MKQTSVSRRFSAVHGFTLLQLIVVIAIISMLAALSFGAMGRGRATARRGQCDVNLKGIALALDAFRSERGRYPASLDELVAQKYLLGADALRCPSDKRPDGSYNEYYVVRGPRDEAQLPVLVCPLHERDGGGNGAQAFLGRYTAQYKTSPAVLQNANNTYVTRPDGKGEVTGFSGMPLGGGDRIRTSGGGAKIRFADGSTIDIESSGNITVLQSFLDGNANAPLYTLVRQTLGRATYKIHHGSKFDVATPTVTAGARGTEFVVSVASNTDSEITLNDGRVLLSTVERSAWMKPGQTVSVGAGILGLLGLPGLLGGLL